MKQNRIYFCAFGFVALVAALALGDLFCEEESAPALSPPHPWGRAQKPGGGELPDRVSVDRRLVSSNEPASQVEPVVDRVTEQEDGSRRAVGVVYGRIYDAGGVPVPSGMIVFLRSGIGKGKSFSAIANREGDYKLDLHVGRWDVYFGGGVGVRSRGFLLVGHVDVEEERAAEYDLFVLGDRNFEGAFLYSDMDEIALTLELFYTYDALAPVATAYCSTNALEYEFHLENESKRREWAERNSETPREPLIRPPGKGPFRITGLPADVYEMRLYLDLGKKLYVRAIVDLTLDDLVLEPIVLTKRDFFDHRTLEF